MIKSKNPKLAINGGNPVTDSPVIIHKPYLDAEDFNAVDRSIRSTFVSGDGPDCREFEKLLARYLDVKHVLFVNSATSALELAFRVKDFPAGSEVIVPDFTYTSTALGALYNNLKIVLADVNPDNGNIDISKLESYITSRTVAIAPVDYAGNPAEMDEITGIARKHNLFVVHDTAQSIGAVYKGRRTGSQGDVSTFSFHGTKNLTTGEGGALVTDDDIIAARVKILREKGTDKYTYISENKTRGYYEYVDVGNSYVQSNILGALGVSQLSKIDFMLEERREIAEYYISSLKGIPHLGFLRITADSLSNWHLFGILVPPADKEWIIDALRAEGIMANVHYSPLHRNRLYKSHGDDSGFPGAVSFFNQLVRLPIYPSLNKDERKNVVAAISKIFEN